MLNYLHKLFFILLIFGVFVSSSVNAQTQLWGMTNLGGQYGIGTIFSVDSTGNNETLQHSFTQHDGANPLFTNLIQANDGMLYGMTYQGGANDFGVFFQFNSATLTYTKKFDFDSLNGSKPLGSLLQASNGMIYGMAYKGGMYDKGVLFEYNIATSTYTKKFDFGAANGCYPHGSLMQAKDGMLYGLTVQGGTNDFGVLFQYNPITFTYTKKFDFDSIHGRYPVGSLMQASDSMFYGFTAQGGINDIGVLFQYNPTTTTCTKKFDFTQLNGNAPLGFLIEASDTNFYGMTNRGGANDMGVLFQYNPATSLFTKKFDFDSIHGSYPDGSLIQTTNKNIYGMTSLGGTNNAGVLFQYNPTTSIFTKKFDYDSTNGALPYGSLIEVNVNKADIFNHLNLSDKISAFPNPNSGAFTIQSNEEGIYLLVNALGETMQSFKLNATNNYIAHIENLNNGVYSVIGIHNNYTYVQKVLVVK